MEIRHCPRCELRFSTESEVRDHLVEDHGLDPQSVERRVPGWDAKSPDERDAPDIVRPQRSDSDARRDDEGGGAP